MPHTLCCAMTDGALRFSQATALEPEEIRLRCAGPAVQTGALSFALTFASLAPNAFPLQPSFAGRVAVPLRLQKTLREVKDPSVVTLGHIMAGVIQGDVSNLCSFCSLLSVLSALCSPCSLCTLLSFSVLSCAHCAQRSAPSTPLRTLGSRLSLSSARF